MRLAACPRGAPAGPVAIATRSDAGEGRAPQVASREPQAASRKPIDMSVLTRPAAIAWADRLRAGGKKIVFTNGVFDLLHPGHVRYLAEARSHGDALIVAVNSDRSVRAIKGPARPVNREEERAEVLAALSAVDSVVVFDEDDPHAIISAIQPDILRSEEHTSELQSRQYL